MMRFVMGLALAAALALGAAVPASAGTVKVSVKAVASCTPKRVNVRFADGSVHRVTHVVPGRRIQVVQASTKNLFVLVRVRASWARVTGGAGHRLRLTADGPASEQWTWRFRLHAANPLADPTDYVVCLHPLVGTRSFVTRMQRAHGSWVFTAALTTGRYAPSEGATTVTAS